MLPNLHNGVFLWQDINGRKHPFQRPFTVGMNSVERNIPVFPGMSSSGATIIKSPVRRKNMLNTDAKGIDKIGAAALKKHPGDRRPTEQTIISYDDGFSFIFDTFREEIHCILYSKINLEHNQ